MSGIRVSLIAGCMAALLLPSQAGAIPLLQLYIEGASYDHASETWVTTQRNFNLWVIGNTLEADIENVNLAISHLSGETGAITLTPTTTSLLYDPSVSLTPHLVSGVGAEGTRPHMQDGRFLSPHGVYGPGVSFHQYALGDFTLRDSPIADFSESFPHSFPRYGQISAYTVDVTGYSGIHIDAFGQPEGRDRSTFAPFSHDAAGSYRDRPPPVPEPATLALLGLGFVGAGFARRRRNRPAEPAA